MIRQRLPQQLCGAALGIKEQILSALWDSGGNFADENMKAVNFFSILKSECIYRFKPKTFAEANEMIDRYLYFYNHKRIQLKTEVAPLTLRHSA
ncbi:MAG: IS3 family transposase [Neglectibacter timonensis]|uniref:IS3 family transposase n=2 Tax=Neglectibacter timonensis TaxID=1776382 RepID=UPI003995CDED